MWELNEPDPVKLIFGILAADKGCLTAAVNLLFEEFGKADFVSDTYDFYQTQYYRDQAGENILRQFLSFEKLIDPGQLARVKIRANEIEVLLAKQANTDLPRPVNLDPGIIEPSKLVLASTKNFSHRIYIGDRIYAELTLSYCRGKWESFPYTFPDYRESRYHPFFSRVRGRLVEQLREYKEK